MESVIFRENSNARHSSPITSTSVFKFFSKVCPQHMSEIYKTTDQSNTVTY